MVQRARANPNQRLARARLRIRNLLVSENLGAAMLMETNGEHNRIGKLVSW
jgi:hypothetical protein